jgi:hypothetical protein
MPFRQICDNYPYFMRSLNRLFRQLFRDFRRGGVAAYHDYKIKPRIAEWAWPYWADAPQPVPVHIIMGEHDWQQGAWTLASFFHWTEHTWKIAIHDDGTLSDQACSDLEALFPRAHLIRRSDANASVGRHFSAFPLCHEYRSLDRNALKIFDAHYFSQSLRYILLDTSVLFFKYPREIMDWVTSCASECWLTESPAEQSLISTAVAKTELQISLWPRAHAGICLLTKAAVDFNFCELMLCRSNLRKNTSPKVHHTLLALCASRHGKGGLLPAQYQHSTKEQKDTECTARIYTGKRSEYFFSEGIRYLREVLLDRSVSA